MAAIINKQLSSAAIVLISSLISMAIGVVLYFVASISYHAHLQPSALSVDNDDDNKKKKMMIIFERAAIAMVAMPVVIDVCGVVAIVVLRKLHVYDGSWLLKPLLTQYCSWDLDEREDVEDPFVYGSSSESDESMGSPQRSNKYDDWYGQRRSLSMNDMEKATGLLEGVGSLMDGELDIESLAFCCKK